MKKIILTFVAAITLLSLGARSQNGDVKIAGPYEFTDVSEVPMTPVKDQSRSGTCWSFAGLATVEAELLKNGKGEYDLSEMWIVRHTYYDKAVKYVRMHGTVEFAGGGATHDVFNVIKKYGIVPEDVYTGLRYGTDAHRHGELDAVLKAYVDAVVKNPNKTLSTKWLEGVNGILDAYLGPVPEKFTYKGREYTPHTFARSLGLDMDDFITFTSYTHHPFYVEFALEIPDNWAWGLSWNVPLGEMMSVVDYALEKGHSVNWGADVSEPGFLYRRGYAVAPNTIVEDMSDTELAKWVSLTADERQSIASNPAEPIKEIRVTQDNRQTAFDNYETTDDHGMVIMGTAKDQNGSRFYKVKNSWGTDQLFGGYFYASRPYVEYKTMNITVHKDGIPAGVRKKLGIE